MSEIESIKNDIFYLQEIDKIQHNLTEKEMHVIKKINQINNPMLRYILLLKDVENKTYAEISRKIWYSVSHLKRLHRKAIEEYEKISHDHNNVG